MQMPVHQDIIGQMYLQQDGHTIQKSNMDFGFDVTTTNPVQLSRYEKLTRSNENRRKNN